jgi:hypothetical protein
MGELQKEAKAKILKSILNKISDTSLTFNQINNKLPLQKAINEGRLDEIIAIYEQLVLDLYYYLKSTEYGRTEKKSTTR